MKLKITKVQNYTTNRESQPLLDKNSRPYTRITIQTEQYPGKWISGLGYQGDAQLSWKVGDEVEADVVPNGQYLNFNLPRTQKGSGGMSPEVVEKLFEALRKVYAQNGQILLQNEQIMKKLDALETAPSEEDKVFRTKCNSCPTRL